MRQCEERQKPSVFGFWKGFVVAASNKVIYKFIGTHYAIVVGGANAAKAKCKAVRNRKFGERQDEKSKYWCLSVCFYKAIHKVSIKPSMRHILWVAALLGASELSKLEIIRKRRKLQLLILDVKYDILKFFAAFCQQLIFTQRA